MSGTNAAVSTKKDLPSTPQKKEIGTLVVVVLKARNLNNLHFYKSDVFAQIKLNGESQKTPADIKGGQHPLWDHELRFVVMEDDAELHRKLQVGCYGKEPKVDELLGEGVVDLTETLKTGEFDDWVPLRTNGTQRGDLYLEMTFFASAPAPIRASRTSLASQDMNLNRRPSKLTPKERMQRPATSPQNSETRVSGYAAHSGAPSGNGHSRISSAETSSPQFAANNRTPSIPGALVAGPGPGPGPAHQSQLQPNPQMLGYVPSILRPRNPKSSPTPIPRPTSENDASDYSQSQQPPTDHPPGGYVSVLEKRPDRTPPSPGYNGSAYGSPPVHPPVGYVSVLDRRPGGTPAPTGYDGQSQPPPVEYPPQEYISVREQRPQSSASYASPNVQGPARTPSSPSYNMQGPGYGMPGEYPPAEQMAVGHQRTYSNASYAQPTPPTLHGPWRSEPYPANYSNVDPNPPLNIGPVAFPLAAPGFDNVSPRTPPVPLNHNAPHPNLYQHHQTIPSASRQDSRNGELSNPYLIARYTTPLPLPPSSEDTRNSSFFSSPQRAPAIPPSPCGPAPTASIEHAQAQAEIPASAKIMAEDPQIARIRAAEEQVARRKEQEAKDMELARMLDRELNLEIMQGMAT